MDLSERQEQQCAASRWDFSDLRAIFLNCTLKKSPELSHTNGLIEIKWDKRDPQITLSIRDVAGQTVAQQEISLSELSQ